MRIRVLGCSGGIGPGLATTSFLVDNDILIDAGAGATSLTIEHRRHVRHVFLTHSHLDPLFVETAFANKDIDLARKACHYSPQLLAEDLTKLRHRPVVCLSHLMAGDEEMIMQECRDALPEGQLKHLHTGDVFEL